MMTTNARRLLHIDASLLGSHSVTRQLSTAIVERLKALEPDIRIDYRDLATDPIDHLSGKVLAAGMDPEKIGDEALADEIARNNAILDQFLAAHTVVLGVPMYNYSVPSSLKAWLDRLAVAGKTFRYTEEGSVGLVGNKRIVVASARGNSYAPDEAALLDHQENYLTAIFGFFGIDDVEFVRAEGVAVSPEHRQRAIRDALEQIARLSG